MRVGRVHGNAGMHAKTNRMIVDTGACHLSKTSRDEFCECTLMCEEKLCDSELLADWWHDREESDPAEMVSAQACANACIRLLY